MIQVEYCEKKRESWTEADMMTNRAVLRYCPDNEPDAQAGYLHEVAHAVLGIDSLTFQKNVCEQEAIASGLALCWIKPDKREQAFMLLRDYLTTYYSFYSNTLEPNKVITQVEARTAIQVANVFWQNLFRTKKGARNGADSATNS